MTQETRISLDGSFQKRSARPIKEVLADGPRVREGFEKALAPEIENFYSAIDSLIKEMEHAAPIALAITSPKVKQVTLVCIMLLKKVVSDSLASWEILRLGYYEPAVSICRSALESLTTALAVYYLPNVCDQYRQGRYSTDSSIMHLKKKGSHLTKYLSTHIVI